MNSADRNNLLTASRMGTFLRCPRAHYWQCEVGLRSSSSSPALRLGTAWHMAMEMRWKGKTFDEALQSALDTSSELDAYVCATIGSLLAGYFWYWGDRETVAKMYPESKFDYKLNGSRTFSVAGKIDGLGILQDSRTVLIEAKTTSDSLAPESDYWLRLRFNAQVYQYVSAARAAGWDISEVLYDVCRKPGIRPKMVNDLDPEGRKIVLSNNGFGHRVFLKNGQPRLSGDTKLGYVIKEHRETPDEFGDRLLRDIQSRPEFYFQRREVPILDDDLIAFESQRLMIGRSIIHARSEEPKLKRPEDAWPRNVDSKNCKFCSYQSFCLQNISVDINQPPAGFVAAGFNPELADDSTNEEEHATE